MHNIVWLKIELFRIVYWQLRWNFIWFLAKDTPKLLRRLGDRVNLGAAALGDSLEENIGNIDPQETNTENRTCQVIVEASFVVFGV